MWHANNSSYHRLQGVTAPSIAHLMLGVKSMNNGSLAQYLTGDIAEMMCVLATPPPPPKKEKGVGTLDSIVVV